MELKFVKLQHRSLSFPDQLEVTVAYSSDETLDDVSMTVRIKRPEKELRQMTIAQIEKEAIKLAMELIR